MEKQVYIEQETVFGLLEATLIVTDDYGYMLRTDGDYRPTLDGNSIDTGSVHRLIEASEEIQSIIRNIDFDSDEPVYGTKQYFDAVAGNGVVWNGGL